MGRLLKNYENHAMMSWCYSDYHNDNDDNDNDDNDDDDNDDDDDGDDADDKQGWADVSRGRSSVVAAAAS